ncbi:MAG: response regulator [Acidimicrobiales bacterium]
MPVAVPRIMVVDDDPDFAEGLELLLGTEGYEVVAVHSAPAVTECLRDFEPDVALIDVRLAGSSGLDLIATMKHEYADVLCVMMTAYASADTAIEALQRGAYDFLRKPFRDNEILATLERSLERRRLEVAKASVDHDLRARNDELEDVNRRLRAVVDGMRALPSSSGVDDLCPKIVDAVAENIAAAGGSFYLIEGDELVLKYALDPGHAEPSIPLANQDPRSVFAVALESGMPVLVRDIAQNDSLVPSGWSGYREPSLLAYPLLGEHGERLGVLSLHEKRDPPFTIQDRDFGEILVSFACETLRAVEALESLAASEERSRSLIETSPMCIQELDLSGTLLSMNRAGFDMMGLDHSVAVEDIDAFRHIDLTDRVHAREMFEEASGGTPSQFQATASFKSGSRTLLTSYAPLLNTEGAVHKVMAIAEDVTERRAAEEQLHHGQKMDALGQLTGGVAHDVNNILAVIMGNADVLARLLADDEDLLRHANQVVRAAARGGELTQRLLAFSRRQPLRSRTIDLAELVDGMIDMLTRALGETIELKATAQPDLWPIVADSSQTENAILNVALNARDAMPDGGTVEITLSNVTGPGRTAEAGPESVVDGDRVRLSVTDSGAGMDSQILDHAFEPFFTTKGVGEGSGLGLSTVYGFANQSGGAVWIETAEGAGTTVNLELPRATAPMIEAHVDSGQSEPRGRGETVLVVEDDADVLALALAMLESLGYQVLTAEDGPSALRILAGDRSVDVLLSDVVLPGGLSGPDLALEASRLDDGINVLFMSGYADVTNAERQLLAGESNLLSKPFRQSDLALAMRTMLDGESGS